MKMMIKFLATGFYSGMFPFFPGTIGSIIALLLAWFLKFNLLQILLLILLGVYLCTRGEEIFNEQDCAHIVYDEFCGMFLATWSLNSLLQFLLAFVLFRIFDILKPNPINKLQELPRGWGVMADDLAAALITRLLLAVLIYLGMV